MCSRIIHLETRAADPEIRTLGPTSHDRTARATSGLTRPLGSHHCRRYANGSGDPGSPARGDAESRRGDFFRRRRRIAVAVELVLDVFVQRPRRRCEVARRGGRYRFCKTGYDLPDVRR